MFTSKKILPIQTIYFSNTLPEIGKNINLPIQNNL